MSESQEMMKPSIFCFNWLVCSYRLSRQLNFDQAYRGQHIKEAKEWRIAANH